MEQIVFLAVIAACLIVFALFGIRNEKISRRNFMNKMKNSFGKAPNKKYTSESFLHIPKYFEQHKTPNSIDDITWKDLDLDNVFARINYCRSAAGEEVLYNMLRCPDIALEQEDPEKFRRNFEEHIEFFEKNENERIKAQLFFEDMRQISKYSVYDHLNVLISEKGRSGYSDYISLILLILCAAGCFFKFEIFFVLTIGVIIANILTYYKKKNEMAPYLATFSYVIRLIRGSENLLGLLKKKEYVSLFNEETSGLENNIKTMKPFLRGSFLVMSSQNSGSGSPLDIIFDYIKIFTHIDLIKFNSMYKQLFSNKKQVDEMISITGFTEASLSIACLRASLSGKYCKPEFVSDDERDKRLIFEEAYHPLIVSSSTDSSVSNSISNSISCEKNILITGSNASGKSTFLKMTAINACMAQSFNTVFAKSYKAPYYDIYSSMALSDNLSEGESYYIVEIKSLKRILDAVKKSRRRILCFIDEVLRGTNTLERISASAQILKSFSHSNVQCFAATHDGELTEILEDIYDNYHFDSSIENGDIHFDYKLRKGKSKTRNAIQLLRLIGYDEDIAGEAEKMAAKFLYEGVWEKLS